MAQQCALHGASLVPHHIGDLASEQDMETLLKEIQARSTGPAPVAVAADLMSPDAGTRLVDMKGKPKEAILTRPF